MASNLIKDLLFDICLPAVYKAACLREKEPGRVLFVEYRTARMPDSFKLIDEALRSRGDIECRFVALDRSHVSYPEFVRRSVKLLREMAAARVIFLSDINEVVSCVNKRRETKVVQLWHACGAFKKFGASTIGNEHGTDAKWLRRHPLYRNIDLVTVSAPAVREAYAEAMDLKDRPGAVQSTGVSRTDIYFKEGAAAAARNRFYSQFPEAEGKKILLYAPTFRGRTPHVTTAPGFDPRALLSMIGDDFCLVIKHHPLVKEVPPVPAGEGIVLDAGGMKIEDLLFAADMVITDYSSLIFEYSLFERPMFFFACDLEEYLKWNGFYEPYEKMIPGPLCRTMEELAREIMLAADHFDPGKIRRFRKKYMESCDGAATERILSLVLGEGGK